MEGRVMKEVMVVAEPWLKKNEIVVRWIDHDGEQIASDVYVRKGYVEKPMFHWDKESGDWVLNHYDPTYGVTVSVHG